MLYRVFALFDLVLFSYLLVVNNHIMNCREINENYSIVEYLSSKNIQPKRISGNNYFYLSPFRKENEASFKVDIKLNKYFDFGEGKGSGLVTLISRIENISIKEIVYKYSNNSFSFQKLVTSNCKDSSQQSKVKVVKSKRVFSYVLKNYLRERGVNSIKAFQFLEEIIFTVNDGNEQFALGFKNNDGNYELRNKNFKGCNGKNLTIINNDSEDKSVFVFEGFFDFLSFLEINNYPNFNFVILNSTSNFSKLLHYLNQKKIQKIHLYFDNDVSGNGCTNEIISRFKSISIDHRIEYKNFKDLNAFLIDSIKEY